LSSETFYNVYNVTILKVQTSNTLRAVCTNVDQSWSKINDSWIKQTCN